MAPTEPKARYPQDIVAIFHASFHPTQGNVVDWSLKSSDDLSLDKLEFSALPSGLHLVEQDVVYFTKDDQHGVCVFRRRKTGEQGQRGFRLSSLGILLAKSRRPRPWRHTADLKELIMKIYSQSGESDTLQPEDSHWEPARAFFDERKVRRADLGGAGDWNGWSHEFDELETDPPNSNPTLHLPHLLRILGPSALTLYKHVLGRRRILIYTLPPVEAACILCQVAADICYEAQYQGATTDNNNPNHPSIRRLNGKSTKPINVLGMVNLNDLDRLQSQGKTGHGWIACTTDAIFLEKPSYYDLLIDLTTSTPNKATRPTFYTSKPVSQPSGGNSRGPIHRLSPTTFAWSDIKLWNELDRILQLDAGLSSHQDCCAPSAQDGALKSKLVTTWTDAWRVYEDVCVICAGLWMGSWRGNSTMSYSTAGGAENWGRVRLEGDDDLSIGGSAYIRSLGQGIEGGPTATGSQVSGSTTLSLPTNRAMRRSSNMSWSSSRATVVGASSSTGGPSSKARQVSTSSIVEHDTNDTDYDDSERRDAQLRTTLSLIQTFHAHTTFQLSVLESFLPHDTPLEPQTVYLSPKDILAFELGPLSGFDAKYLEWLAQEYAGGTVVVVRRGWRDLLGAIFGYS
ncbi:hypothetical protein BDZ94DRAFT_1250646 [Collybia nuda]|uniref:Protein LCHN n=1 Tax=Collybia nuda TaxID=64659 RepID=A0A9P5YDN4_9AGAR|nr:hypothetical protein BDZ94DRAFT_1250646 [Collybia nuda]